MPIEQAPQRDDWTHLESPDAAAAAIAKLEALGRSPAEASARQHYLDILDIGLGHAVVDVGAGTGVTAVEMAKRVGSSGRVVALDASARLGSFTRQAAERAGVGDVLECWTSRAETLPSRTAFSTAAFVAGCCCTRRHRTPLCEKCVG